MELTVLPKNSVYHRFGTHTEYTVGEMMELADALEHGSLYKDVDALIRHPGSDEDIIAFESWRINLYNHVQLQLLATPSRLQEPVTCRLAMLLLFIIYPMTLEAAHWPCSVFKLFMQGRVPLTRYAGLMGGYEAMLQFTDLFDPYFERLGAIDRTTRAESIPTLMLPEL